MRAYETMVILHPELAGDALEAGVEKLKGILEKQQAEILKVDNWGTRRLAYPVKKQGRGTYMLMIYRAAADVIAEFERRMRIDESVLKYQTVLLEKEPEIEVPAVAEADAEETVAAAEEAEAPAETEAAAAEEKA